MAFSLGFDSLKLVKRGAPVIGASTHLSDPEGGGFGGHHVVGGPNPRFSCFSAIPERDSLVT